MFSLARTVRARRNELGLSQAQVATDARVSLATVQKVEAGTANPSLSTLRSLLAPLGLSLGIKPVPVDWDLLVAHGLPLTSTTGRNLKPDAASLARQVRLASLEAGRDPMTPDGERKRDALRALLLALHVHFPSTARRLSRSAAVKALLDEPLSGRVVKLARIALSRLAEYL